MSLPGEPARVSHRLDRLSLDLVVWLGLNVVVLLELGGWDPSELVEETPVVEPVDPFQGGQFEVAEATPWPPVAAQLRLVEAADDRLGEGVVIGVASRSH